MWGMFGYIVFMLGAGIYLIQNFKNDLIDFSEQKTTDIFPSSNALLTPVLSDGTREPEISSQTSVPVYRADPMSEKKDIFERT